ncbi:NEMP2 isoform 3, partial [Pan troglodytes]
DCYCYNQNSQVEWKYIWSTMQGDCVLLCGACQEDI